MLDCSYYSTKKNIAKMYASETYNALIRKGITGGEYSFEQKMWTGSQIINELVTGRAFPQKMIYGMIKKFDNKVYSLKSFERKLEFLQEDIEILELYSIPSQRKILEDLPKYLTHNTMTVGSGLYLATNELIDIVHCKYCWFFPIIKSDLKIRTIIASDNELSSNAAMYLNKMISFDEFDFN
jgi:hypothetical protein